MLVPIAPDNSRGRNMEFEAGYDAIREARKSDPDDLPQDEWSGTLRKADWPEVIRLSQFILIHESKDLQVVCWLTEALLHQYGLPGLARGIEFMQMFVQTYGDICWPEPDEDGECIHHCKLEWLDRQLQLPLIRLLLVGQPESSLDYWHRVQAFEHKLSLSPSQREMLLQEGDFSLSTFQRWGTGISSAVLEQVGQVLIQVKAGLDGFENSYRQHHPDVEGGIMPLTKQTLEDMEMFLRRISEFTVNPYDDVMNLNVLKSAPPPPPTGQVETNLNSQQMLSRDLAVSQMLTIAHFFRQTEPSSPVPFLMERAARWANMTLAEWLEEMLQDDNSLRDINHVLKGRDCE